MELMHKVTLYVFFDVTDHGSGPRFTYHNPLCIPDVGERITCFATQDEYGNYGPGRERQVKGCVVERRFAFMQRGSSSADWHNAMHITIYAESDPPC